jgi:hypothetical protein
MMILNNQRDIENKNAASLRVAYNELVHEYNDLSNRSHNRENQLLKQVKTKTEDVQWFADDRVRNMARIRELTAEVENLQETLNLTQEKLAKSRDFSARQKDWIEKSVAFNEEQKQYVIGQQKKITALTQEVGMWKHRENQMEQDFRQQEFAVSAIANGTKNIPLEFRVKAAAECYVRYPGYSQGTVDYSGMSDEKKAKIEVIMFNTMFPETGPKRGEAWDLYKKAKEEVAKDVAKEVEAHKALVREHDALVKLAVDNGEDPNRVVPDLWTFTTQRKLEAKLEAEAKVINSVDEGENESSRPGM